MKLAPVMTAMAAGALLLSASCFLAPGVPRAQPRMIQPTEMRMPPAGMIAAPALPPANPPWVARGSWQHEVPLLQAPRRAVWPNELMSYSERFEFHAKLREARSPAERYELKAKKYAELEKRAVEHGLVLRDSGPGMAMAERYGGFNDARPVDPQHWAGAWMPERQVDPGRWQGAHVAPLHTGPMHVHPPMGR